MVWRSQHTYYNDALCTLDITVQNTCIYDRIKKTHGISQVRYRKWFLQYATSFRYYKRMRKCRKILITMQLEIFNQKTSIAHGEINNKWTLYFIQAHK